MTYLAGEAIVVDGANFVGDFGKWYFRLKEGSSRKEMILFSGLHVMSGSAAAILPKWRMKFEDLATTLRMGAQRDENNLGL